MVENLKIYNTLSGKKETFKPLKNKKVNMFVCGPTVYDFSHIGHARNYIFFDFLVKYLKLRFGYKVFYLQNITNIDDKIILRAKEKGVSPEDLAKAFEKEYLSDMKALGITSVSKYARATDYIKEIISQIKRLRDNGHAYIIHDGIYFDIATFGRYGKLSNRTVLQAEDSMSRIDYSKNKKNRGDFCLFKFSEGHEGEPIWKSPWGDGRPGWHIEDTAITEKVFGSQYDVHGGARDLIFPHHEAEIAQMESLGGKRPMAKYWMHSGFLTTDGQKMSKSLNNFITVKDFLRRYSKEEVRFWFAKSLWRSPLNYTESTMIEVKSALQKIEEFLSKIHPVKYRKAVILPKAKLFDQVKKIKVNFYENLADDFNTPKAFAAIFDFIKELNKLLGESSIDKKSCDEILKFFKEINDIFGIINFKRISRLNIPDEVKKLAEEREICRKSQDWAKADEIRKEIEKYGYSVEDTKDGPLIKKLDARS